jgi:methylenetetrahydrofolate reductase (NADPH)
MPVTNFAGIERMASSCGTALPVWLGHLFEGLDDLLAARQLIAATVAAELCGQLYAGGVRHFHFYAQPRGLHAICHLLGVRAEMTASHFLRAEAKRI